MTRFSLQYGRSIRAPLIQRGLTGYLVRFGPLEQTPTSVFSQDEANRTATWISDIIFRFQISASDASALDQCVRSVTSWRGGPNPPSAVLAIRPPRWSPRTALAVDGPWRNPGTALRRRQPLAEPWDSPLPSAAVGEPPAEPQDSPLPSAAPGGTPGQPLAVGGPRAEPQDSSSPFGRPSAEPQDGPCRRQPLAESRRAGMRVSDVADCGSRCWRRFGLRS